MNMGPRKLKVLIASSTTAVLPSMKFIIKKSFKHDVITASQPEEVIQQLRLHKQQRPVDLIITGAFKHSETNYTGIVKQARKIDPGVLCALYTGDNFAGDLARDEGIRLDGCIMKKNGFHADLKPLFDKLTGIA